MLRDVGSEVELADGEYAGDRRRCLKLAEPQPMCDGIAGGWLASVDDES
jgi:hypothetical protein